MPLQQPSKNSSTQQHQTRLPRATSPVDPRRHIEPARLAQAEKTAAILQLLKSARRCSRCLGRAADAALLELVKETLALVGAKQ